ncbi:MAG: hypothetical protein V4561_12290 [Bacteroidota bacterium]
MSGTQRFLDDNISPNHFFNDVLIECPGCKKQAIVTINYTDKIARLFCTQCGYIKETSPIEGNDHYLNRIFENVNLWLEHSFRNNVFYAFNYKHLEYLERYIGASLREHRDRTGFTLVEKLPKFYHTSKNREALLKIIETLRHK